MQHNADECKESNDGERIRPGSFSISKVNGLVTTRNGNLCQRLNTQSSRGQCPGKKKKGSRTSIARAGSR